MNRKCSRQRFQLAVYLFLALVCAFPGRLLAEQFAVGSQFPPFTLPAPDSADVQKYLGLKNSGPFSLSQTNAKVVIVEFMSALCPHCQANAPVINKVFKTVQEDAGLAANVRVLAIAVGNDQKQVDAYKKAYNVGFPMFVDESFAISGPIGGVDTPTTLVLAAASGKVLACHTGLIKDFDGFVKELRDINKKQ